MGLSNELSCKAGNYSHCHNLHRYFQSEVLRLYFPMLEPWVVWSISLLSCSSWFIRTQIWNGPVHKPPPCLSSSLPHCLSPPLLPVWMNVSSLTPWLSDFHTGQFSGSSGYFFCPSFGCARRHNVSTYTSILAGSPNLHHSKSNGISM